MGNCDTPHIANGNRNVPVSDYPTDHQVTQSVDGFSMNNGPLLAQVVQPTPIPKETRPYSVKVDHFYQNAQQLMGKEEFAKAVSVLEEGILLDPNAVKLVSALAKSYFELGKYEDAVTHYKRALKLEPTEGKLYYQLAQVYKKQGNTEEVLNILEEGTKMASQDPFLWTQRAYALYGENKTEAALAVWKQALDHHPLNPDLHFAYAKVLIDLQRYPEAAAALNEVIFIGKERVAEANGALTDLRKIISQIQSGIQPTIGGSLLKEIKTPLLETRSAGEVEEELQKAEQLASPDALNKGAERLLWSGDFLGVVRLLEKRVGAFKENEKMHLLLAEAYMGLERFQDAVDQCRVVKELNPDNLKAAQLLRKALAEKTKRLEREKNQSHPPFQHER